MHASSTSFRQEMSSSLRDALCFLESRISQGAPRKIMTSVHDTMYVLTDASFDDDKTGSLGGILSQRRRCDHFVVYYHAERKSSADIETW